MIFQSNPLSSIFWNLLDSNAHSQSWNSTNAVPRFFLSSSSYIGAHQSCSPLMWKRAFFPFPPKVYPQPPISHRQCRVFHNSRVNSWCFAWWMPGHHGTPSHPPALHSCREAGKTAARWINNGMEIGCLKIHGVRRRGVGWWWWKWLRRSPLLLLFLRQKLGKRYHQRTFPPSSCAHYTIFLAGLLLWPFLSAALGLRIYFVCPNMAKTRFLPPQPGFLNKLFPTPERRKPLLLPLP